MNSSVDIAHLHLKFDMCIFKIRMESLSPGLGPSFYSIKCKICFIQNILKVT